MNTPVTVGGLCRKLGMSRQNYYQGRRERQRREADGGLDSVEHIFYIVKRLFGYRKVVYRGIAKNTRRLYMLFASACSAEMGVAMKPVKLAAQGDRGVVRLFPGSGKKGGESVKG
jgi:hypothetical protein